MANGKAQAVQSSNDKEKKQANPEIKEDIQFIKGHTNILLIAPHGHKKDDKNTGKLVRLIAEQGGCYAIINETYRKPDKEKKEQPEKENQILNLNHIDHVEDNLKDEFLSRLLVYKDEIKEQYRKCYIFWIHGAYDTSVEIDSSSQSVIPSEDVQALIGYGQDKVEDEPRHTASPDTVKKIIQGLTQEGLKAVLANETIRQKNIGKEDDDKQKSYCAWDRRNMNQLFAVKNYQGGSTEYIDGNVQSVQIEFREAGCRTEDSLNPTAVKFLNGISALVQPEIKATSTENKIPDKAQEQRMNSCKKTEYTGETLDAKDEGKSESMPPGNEDSNAEVPSKSNAIENENTKTKLEDPKSKLPAGTDAHVMANIESEPVEDGDEDVEALLESDGDIEVEEEVNPGPIEKIPAQEIARTQKMTDEDDHENVIDVGEKASENENALVKATNEAEIVDEDPLVDEAYSVLFGIFSRHYENAMMEAGLYIIKTFYGNDIDNARDNKPTHEQTLNQLYEKIEENKNPNSASRSKLYHAKNLIVQEDDLCMCLDKDSFSTFRNLSLSHKIYLLSVKGIEKKKKLIERVSTQQLSVRQLQAEIKRSRSNDPSPLQLINNPEKIWEGQNIEFISFDRLKKRSPMELKKYQKALASEKGTYEKYLKKNY